MQCSWVLYGFLYPIAKCQKHYMFFIYYAFTRWNQILAWNVVFYVLEIHIIHIDIYILFSKLPNGRIHTWSFNPVDWKWVLWSVYPQESKCNPSNMTFSWIIKQTLWCSCHIFLFVQNGNNYVIHASSMWISLWIVGKVLEICTRLLISYICNVLHR